MKIKDRVKQKSGNGKTIGTVVKVFKGKGKNKSRSAKTCAVLWDHDWPRNEYDRRGGRVYYYKLEDLIIIDTWSLDTRGQL
jgi:hypothetical protein